MARDSRLSLGYCVRSRSTSSWLTGRRVPRAPANWSKSSACTSTSSRLRIERRCAAVVPATKPLTSCWATALYKQSVNSGHEAHKAFASRTSCSYRSRVRRAADAGGGSSISRCWKMSDRAMQPVIAPSVTEDVSTAARELLPPDPARLALLTVMWLPKYQDPSEQAVNDARPRGSTNRWTDELLPTHRVRPAKGRTDP